MIMIPFQNAIESWIILNHKSIQILVYVLFSQSQDLFIRVWLDEWYLLIKSKYAESSQKNQKS